MTTKKVSSNIEAFVKRVKKRMEMTPKKIVLKKEVVRTLGDLLPKEPAKSKGQEFKEQHGFSKTFKRNMQKISKKYNLKWDYMNPEHRAKYRKERNLLNKHNS